MFANTYIYLKRKEEGDDVKESNIDRFRAMN